MTIVTYLGCKYTASYYIVNLVGAATNAQNPTYDEATYILILFN